MSMSPEEIQRYVDGELVGPEREAFEQLIKEDPDLQRAVDDAFRMNGMLRAAFAQSASIPAGMPDILHQHQGVKAPANDAWTFGGGSMAGVAASVLFFFAAGFGGFVAGERTEMANQARFVAALSEQQTGILQQALEFNLSGDPVTWSAENVGVSVTPIQTYQRPDGSYCREYRKEITLGQVTLQEHGLACRNKEAEWAAPSRTPDA